MTKKGRPEALPPAEERHRRVSHLLDLLFGGNQRRASRALGISQAHISKVVHETRPVTEHFIQSLAQQPGVNLRWLLEGEGEPLLSPTAGTLPVAAVLLPGPPRQHSALLTGALSRG